MKLSTQSKLLPCLLAPTVLINSFAAIPAFAGIAPELTLHPDSAQTYCQEPLTIDVLNNDSGLDLNIKSVDQPVWVSPGAGSTAIVGNKIVYSPSNNFTGNAKFWYVAEDSIGESNYAEVNVTVSATDFSSPWPKAGDDRADTEAGKPIYINPFWNDTGCQLKIKSIEADYSNRGTMKIDNNQLAYTPDATRRGEDVFWYVIEDVLGRTNYAEVRVAVTGSNIDPGPYPTGTPDVVTVYKDSDKDDVKNSIDVLSNDSGSDLVLIEVPESGSHGTVTQEGQVLKYQPNSGYTGPDKFYYAFKDSFGRSNYSYVTINVVDKGPGSPNTAPVARRDSLAISKLATETEINILGNDIDPDGDSLKVISIDPSSSMIFSLAIGGLERLIGIINGSVRLVDGKVLYTPPPYLNEDVIKYVISDGRGGTATAFLSIRTLDTPADFLNFTPTTYSDTATVAPGESVVIRVLENDIDTDGDTIILEGSSDGLQGTTQRIVDSDGVFRAIRYTARSGASGTDEFNYSVWDGRDIDGTALGIVEIIIQPR